MTTADNSAWWAAPAPTPPTSPPLNTFYPHPDTHSTNHTTICNRVMWFTMGGSGIHTRVTPIKHPLPQATTINWRYVDNARSYTPTNRRNTTYNQRILLQLWPDIHHHHPVYGPTIPIPYSYEWCIPYSYEWYIYPDHLNPLYTILPTHPPTTPEPKQTNNKQNYQPVK